MEEFREEDICRAIEEMQLCKGKKLDPFCILGKGAPIFRAMLGGVEYPIEDREDLIAKAGGEDRLVVVPDPDGGQRVYALLDLLDAFPQLDQLFPIESAASLAMRFAVLERKRREEGKPSPLLKIDGKHMEELIRKRSEDKGRPRLPLTRTELRIPIVGLAKEAVTGAALLKALEDIESGKGNVLKAGGGIRIPDWLIELIRALIEYIRNYHREAALAAAASAQQQAAIAEAAADAAESKVSDVAGASTNTQAQQAVTEVCTKAQEAADAAQQAANFAATACAHAGSVPDDTEAQIACSNAQTAASQANSDANRAQDACDKAQDIASISIVTICGHVNEEDDCCDDDVSGAHITVCNLDYPEIPCQSTTTDGNGNYCVTGRFGHSSRIGCANVRVTMRAYGVTINKQITVCSSSPSNVNFSFDAPGWE